MTKKGPVGPKRSAHGFTGSGAPAGTGERESSAKAAKMLGIGYRGTQRLDVERVAKKAPEKKRGPYRTRAATAADQAIALRLQMMHADDATWEQFCRQTLGDWEGTRPHASRRVERGAVIEWWRRRGLSIAKGSAAFVALETEWSAAPQRIILLSRYRIGSSFAPTFIDELLRGTLHQPPFTQPPDADWRLGDPFPAMVRSGPLAPPSVIAEPRLLLAWIDWCGERRRISSWIDDPEVVLRASARVAQRIRDAPRIPDI